MSSREEFEKWATEEGLDIKQINLGPLGDVYMAPTQFAWMGWKAATERAAGIVIDEGPVIGSCGVAIVAEKIMKGNE